jgi:nucleotide-binding universal stress UspA family protein
VRPFIKSLAERFDARLILMHVIQIPLGWYGGIEDGCPTMFDLPAMEESAKQAMRTFLESPGGFAAGEGVEEVVQVGDPATEIARYAEEHPVDLIMMPTHGYGKFRSLPLGSVAAKVLQDAKCPVWTTHTQDPRFPEHLECKNILGAVDLTPETVALIRRYADLAGAFNAKLRLVHAAPGPAPDPWLALDRSLPGFLIQAARQELAKLQAQSGTKLEVCMEGGPVSKIVAAAAQHHDADLVLVGRGVLTEAFGKLRSNTYSIIRDAPCPVLSL